MNSKPKIIIRTEKVLDAFCYQGKKYYLDSEGFLWHSKFPKIVGGIDKQGDRLKVYIFADWLPFSEARLLR